jgi:hypothetical protein
MNRIELPTKTPETTIILPRNGWDFSAYLLQGETIVNVVAQSSVYSGSDPFANEVIFSATPSGTVAIVTLTAGSPGVIYLIQVTVTTTASQVLSLAGYLAVTPELP